MALDTVNVTGTFNLPDAEWVPYSKAQFVLIGLDVDTEVVTEFDRREAILSAIGELQIDLWPNGAGERGTVYGVWVVKYTDDTYTKEVSKVFQGNIQITGDNADEDIGELLAQVVDVPGVWYSTITEDQYDAAIAAVADAEDAADRAEDAASVVGITPESFGAQSGILLDPEARTVVNDVLAAGPCTVQYARLLDETVRFFIRARQNIVASPYSSDPLWDDVTYTVDGDGIVTFAATGLADREQKAFDWINNRYLERVDGANDTSVLEAVTATQLNAAEAIDATANTTALRAWLAAIGNYQATGRMAGDVYPVNDSLRLESGTTIKGVEGYTAIKMVAGQSRSKTVVWTGDIDEPREDIHLKGVIFDANFWNSATGSVSDPVSTSLQGTALSIAYTARFSVVGCGALDAYKHLMDFTGSRHPRSGTAYTYPSYTQVSRDGWIDRCWAWGHGDDGITTHNARDIRIGKIWGGFATQAYGTTNANFLEFDDDTDGASAEHAAAYFAYDACEVKGHSDAKAARNIRVDYLEAHYCNNGPIVRHVDHGDTDGDPTADPPKAPEPLSPTGKNVRFGKVVIRNPLEWGSGDTKAAFRHYAYDVVTVDELSVYQDDADDDYYGTNTAKSDGLYQAFWSAQNGHIGRLYVEGFAGSNAAARITSSALGSITIGEIVTQDGPLHALLHTGDGADVTVGIIDAHRDTATAGSIAVRGSGARTKVGILKASGFEWWQSQITEPQQWAFEDRATFVTAVADGFNAPDGSVIRAGGVEYVALDGATGITGLDGFDANGPVTLAHFGVVPDMTYELQETRDGDGLLEGKYGFVRTGGTDCRSAVIAADAYCAARGVPLIWPDGQYYLLHGEVELTTSWFPESDRGVVIWAQYAKGPTQTDPGDILPSEGAFVIKTSNVQFGIPGQLRFRGIAQFALQDSITGPKETDNGHRGTFLRYNEYYWPEAQPIIRGNAHALELVRAALQRDESGAITQRSVPAILIFVAAGVEDFNHEAGVWGQTNVSSQYIQIMHWGCHYNVATAPFDDATTLNKTPASIIETYHAGSGKLRILGPIDNRDGHALNAPFEAAAAAGPIEIYTTHLINPAGTSNYAGGGGVVSCGDVGNAFATSSQKERVNKDIFVIGSSTQGSNNTEDGGAEIYIKGLGTSKALADVYPGTSVLRQRTPEMDVTIKGARIVFATPNPSQQRGVHVDQVYGSVTIEGLHVEGAHRGVEIEHSYGRFVVRNVTGDACVINNFSDLVTLENVATNRGNDESDTGTAYDFGSTGITRAIEVIGETEDVGTIDGAVAVGAVVLPLAAALTARVNRGSHVSVGGNILAVTETSAIGAETIEVSPVAIALTGSETVTVDRRARAVITRPAFTGSALGIRLIDADAVIHDPGAVNGCGSTLVYASGDSLIEIVGGRLPKIGRSDHFSLSDRRTIWLNDESRVILRGVRVPDNDAVTNHVRRDDDSTAMVDGCIIEAAGSFTTISGSWDDMEWAGNRDYTGARLSHPGYAVEALPVLLIGNSDTGITYSARTGTYYHGENGQVWWDFDFTLSSRGGLTGNLELRLPNGYAASNARLMEPITITPATLTSIPVYLHASGGGSGTEWLLQRQSTTGIASLTESQVTDASRIVGRVMFWRDV